MKRILIALMASMMVITTAACGNSGSTSSTPSESSSTSSSDVASDDSSAPEESAPEESAPETSSSEAAGDVTANATAAAIPVPADATDEEKAYIEELNKALPAIAELQTTGASAATDPESAKKILEDMKPKFEALGNLKAPEKYADVQAKFTEGGKAMNDYIDYMLSIADMTAEEATPEKQQEVMTKMTEYVTTAMTAFSDAYSLMAGIAPADASADGAASASDAAGESSSVAE